MPAPITRTPRRLPRKSCADPWSRYEMAREVGRAERRDQPQISTLGNLQEGRRSSDEPERHFIAQTWHRRAAYRYRSDIQSELLEERLFSGNLQENKIRPDGLGKHQTDLPPARGGPLHDASPRVECPWTILHQE
jgi:hypothetical protein